MYTKIRDLSLKELGKKAEFIPGPEPEVLVNPEMGKIPVSEPDLRGNEEKYVLEALRSTWISSRGQFLDRFEQEFAAKVGAEFGIAVNSGTNALYLAAASLGIGPGDEVIMPTFTMISTPNSVVYLGAKPIFVDSDEYWQMDWRRIEEKITKKTKAIMPVHIYGHPVYIKAIENIAREYKLGVIYDAAEAQGALFQGIKLGKFGNAVCYSFYGNKILTTGEGGMVVTNDPKLAEIARSLKDVAFSTERHFWHKRLGYNFRMTNLAAAVGLAQTERFDELVELHRLHARMYKTKLKGIAGIKTAPEAAWATNVYWMFGILVNKKEYGMSRDELRQYLASKGIETRTFFVPIHLQPYYYRDYKNENYPKAEQLSRDGMYLPSSSLLTQEQIDYICARIKETTQGVL